MSEQKKTITAVYTVLLPSGHEFEHEYEVSADFNEIKKFIHEMTDMMRKGLTRKEDAPLIFNNPVALYNPDNVSGIRFNSISTEALEEFNRDMTRKMGYVKD